MGPHRTHLYTALAFLSWVATASAARVDDFGATGNGITDDTAAIQAALDAARPDDMVVFTPGRTYRIAATLIGLRPKSRTHLVLRGATLMAGEQTAGRHRIVTIDGQSRITISGGTFVGSRAGAPEWGLGVFLSDATDIVIEDAVFRDFYTDSILVTGNAGCRRIVIRRCRSSNAGRAGTGLISGSDIVVEDSVFEGTQNANTNMPRSGLHAEANTDDSLSRITVTRCLFRNNQGPGLYFLVGHGVSLTDVTLTDNVAENNGLGGFLLKRAANVLIRGNRIAGHTTRNAYAIGLADTSTNVIVRNNVLERNYRGIYLEGADAVSIEANTVVGTGAAKVFREGDDGDGILVRGSSGTTPLVSRLVNITGNLIRGVAGRGIMCSQSSEITVAGNVILDTGQHGIHVRSTSADAQVRGNIVARSSLEGSGLYQDIFLSQAATRVVVSQNLLRDGVSARSGIALDNITGTVVAENCLLTGPPIPLAVSDSATGIEYEWSGSGGGWNRGDTPVGPQFLPLP
jgi:parallel beta-helix repeat protein